MDPSIYCVHVETPIGIIVLKSTQGYLTQVLLPNAFSAQDAVVHGTPLLDLAKQQLLDYFNGKRTSFTIPLSFEKSPFFTATLNYLQTIPYGTTISYKTLAIAVQHPRAARAVGRACNKNPLPIFIPCHRVIGTDGRLTGYGGGLFIKRYLLELEKAHCMLE
ncbi:MAG: methylated-DNA--[protein]-cysteine S-methyltransferase [Puniceicoccales bacterium]|nr:methylated-DNA--[protein]-cysteine S-methyltransferase [Puniceicoccales bacterium]